MGLRRAETRPRWLLLGVGAVLASIWACSESKPPYCAALAKVSLSGKVTKQAGQLANALEKLGGPADNQFFGRFLQSLRNLERSTATLFTTVSAENLGEDV